MARNDEFAGRYIDHIRIGDQGVSLKENFMERRILTKAEIIQWAFDNAKLTNSSRLTCVDGRSNLEAPAVAGAHAGSIPLLRAASHRLRVTLAYQTCADIIIGAAGGIENVIGHSDMHPKNDPKSPVAGCGHCMKAADTANTTDYGLVQEDAEWLVNAYSLFATELPPGNIIKFPGEHAEGAVVKITGLPVFLPHSWHNDHLNQAFVYNEEQANAYYRKLAESWIAITKSRETSSRLEQLFKDIAIKQLSATIERLAVYNNRRLPFFEVRFNNSRDLSQITVTSS